MKDVKENIKNLLLLKHVVTLIKIKDGIPVILYADDNILTGILLFGYVQMCPYKVSEFSLCAVPSTFFDKNKKLVYFHFFHRLECDIVNHLLQAQLQMSHWRFLPSLLHLNDARTKLTSLSTVAPVKEVSCLGTLPIR